MFHSRILFHIVASLNTAVLAIPSDLYSLLTIHGNRPSSETRSLGSPVLVNNSLTDTNNLTLHTINFPEYNTSSNAGPTVFCHTNPPFPVPPVWGHVDILECGLLIMTMLADDSGDLRASRWNLTYPLVLPWTGGISPNCKIRINAVNPESSDVFPRVMIAQRAALIVRSCTGNNGGIVTLGPRGQFQVQVLALGIGPPHSVVEDDRTM